MLFRSMQYSLPSYCLFSNYTMQLFNGFALYNYQDVNEEICKIDRIVLVFLFLYLVKTEKNSNIIQLKLLRYLPGPHWD